MKQQQEIVENTSTEEKIKEAARKVFTQKGYAATRTRDIAEASGYNLALINYYFRSKEKLFDIIMVEHLQSFVHSVLGIVNDRHTSLMEKIEQLVSHYIDMLIANPDLPIFVLSAINADPKRLIAKTMFEQVRPENVYLIEQWHEMNKRMEAQVNPMHMMLNILSMTIFPFAASPLFRSKTGMDQDTFNAMMQERKKLIPLWVKTMLPG
jgi:AcrR family transcriptional regulator